MAIIEKDVKKIEQLTERFNVKEYYGMFACIVSGRSWDSINKGIVDNKYTDAEVNTSQLKIKTKNDSF
jgi:aarF domain-containing kinase